MPSLSRALIAHRLPPRRVPERPPPTLPEGLLRAGMRGALAARRPGDALAVFAYGSLMWEREMAGRAAPEPGLLRGFARRWNLHDIHNRGVPEAPGLTLGLEPAPGTCCEGLILTLGSEEALWPIWRHEMLPGFYRAAWVTVVPRPQGPPRRVLTFVADPAHPLHAGTLPEAAQARILARAVGPQGPDAEYLLLAVHTLREHGLSDALLERLAGAVAEQLAAA